MVMIHSGAADGAEGNAHRRLAPIDNEANTSKTPSAPTRYRIATPLTTQVADKATTRQAVNAFGPVRRPAQALWNHMWHICTGHGAGRPKTRTGRG
jgi:hypothetical protein